MSDVGAVLLTLGEPETDRALASLQSQSLPIAEVIVVEGIRPFHRALNSGAQRANSPFFLQIDADFILDPACASTLRRAMTPDTGVAVGALRDPLIGPVAGVKLFRRSCFAGARMGDTIAPDVDFLNALEHVGWRTRYVIERGPRSHTHTMGDHRPAYTVSYVFGTYYLLGARYVYRGDPLALQWRFCQLRRSIDPMAPVARVAMAHGMFAGELRDLPKPAPTGADESFLRTLVDMPDSTRSHACAAAEPALRSLESSSLVALFHEFLQLGNSLRATAHAGFRDCLRTLGQVRHPHSWPAEVALAHGALSEPGSPLPGATMTILERLVSPRTPRLFPRPV